jgi:hypothetical protein
MPEHLKALVVILALATAVFAFSSRPATAVAMNASDFTRRRNLWFAITLVAFLAHNFWFYIVATALLLLYALPREQNKLALYYFLLFAVPAFPGKISGLGVINYFFTIDYLRLLSLAVLLPASLSLTKIHEVEKFGRLLPDKLLAGYLVLQFGLMLTASTFTDALRHGVFYGFLDVFLPYYVASRLPKDLVQFRDILTGFVIAALILAPLGAFEYAKHWLLYSNLEGVLGSLDWGYGVYLEREGLRALASVGQPIVLGYVMAVALGFLLLLSKSISSRVVWGLGVATLLAGLFAPLSRGPWVGAVAILICFIATGPSPSKGLARLGALALVGLPAFLLTPAGEDIVSRYLYGIGDTTANVLYRQRLLEMSLEVISRNPLFGAFDFLYSPEMQQMKQGTGIIDLVNSYLAIALYSGLVGLSLFVGFFVAATVAIFNGMRELPDRNEETYLLGRVLLSTLLGILVIIFTVSSIVVIPVIYWSVAGLCVAYAQMLRIAKLPATAPTPAQRAKAGLHIGTGNSPSPTTKVCRHKRIGGLQWA